MNWRIEGKKKTPKGMKDSHFNLIGPADEAEARQYAQAAHPTFEISSVVPLSAKLRATEGAEAQAEEAAAKPARQATPGKK